MVGREVREEQIRREAAREHGEIGELARGVDGHRTEARRACSVRDTIGAAEQIERERLIVGPEQEQRVSGERLRKGWKTCKRIKPSADRPYCACRFVGRCTISEKLVGKTASVTEKRTGDVADGARIANRGERHLGSDKSVRPHVHAHETDGVVGKDA